MVAADRFIYPKKTREIRTAINDSTRWNGFKFRDDDIIIATWAKSGTTWMQQIVSQVLSQGNQGVSGPVESPWLDLRGTPISVVLERLESQRHRRFIKTHLPVDALGIQESVKYIYVGRDPRDVAWSMHNHQSNFTDQAITALNGGQDCIGPALSRPPCDVREYYLQWLETGDMPGNPMPSYWENVRSWWNVRHLPNVLLVHFNNLKSDLRFEAERISRFLGAEVPDKAWPAILCHCSFDYMRAEADKLEALKAHFRDGARVFVNKGTNGRWKDILSAAEVARCDVVASEQLAADCARWLSTGC